MVPFQRSNFFHCQLVHKREHLFPLCIVQSHFFLFCLNSVYPFLHREKSIACSKVFIVLALKTADADNIKHVHLFLII